VFSDATPLIEDISGQVSVIFRLRRARIRPASPEAPLSLFYFYPRSFFSRPAHPGAARRRSQHPATYAWKRKAAAPAHQELAHAHADHRSDLEQVVADSRGRGLGVGPDVLEPRLAQIDEEQVGEGREPKAQLVGSHLLAAHPVGEQVELRGVFPKILTHPQHGTEAQKLYDDARRVLDELVANNRVHARGVWGVWPAASTGEDVQLFADETRSDPFATFHFLRQQKEKVKPGTPFQSLADFVAPLGSGRADYLGAFAVTAGNEVEEYAKTFRDQHDDYTAILIQALADRLAELFHRKARRFMGFGINEDLALEDLIQERYRGIRPAAGYPACPDHTEKQALWDLLDVEAKAGMELTSSYAMFPPSSVSGLYFFNEAARYFNVGKIGRDQLETYAARKSMPLEEAEKWLAPNLEG